MEAEKSQVRSESRTESVGGSGSHLTLPPMYVAYLASSFSGSQAGKVMTMIPPRGIACFAWNLTTSSVP